MMHVLPINDLKEHTEETTCECGPRYDPDGDICVHNSYDGRELLERAMAAQDFDKGLKAFSDYASQVYLHSGMDERSAASAIEYGLAMAYKTFREKDFTVYLSTPTEN